MQQYKRKDGGIIEAIQFTGDNKDAILELIPKNAPILIFLAFDPEENYTGPAIYKGDWLVKEGEKLSFRRHGQFIDEYEPVSALTVSDCRYRQDEEYPCDIYDDRGFVFSFGFSKTIPDAQVECLVKDFLKKINSSSQPSVQPQSEGGLQWACAADEVPDHDKPLPVKYEGVLRIGNFFDRDNNRGRSFYVRNSTDWQIHREDFSKLFWLKESASPSTANTATSALQSILRNIDNGHWNCGEFREEIKSIAEQGLKTANTEEGAELQEGKLYTFKEAKNIWKEGRKEGYRLAKEESESERPAEQHTEEFISSLPSEIRCDVQELMDILDDGENLLKEQQIAFAEWAGAEGFHYDDGCWFRGVGYVDMIGGTTELYELFLTETKQQ